MTSAPGNRDTPVKDRGKYECSHKRQHLGVKVLTCDECEEDYERPACWPKKQRF